jgi:branched-chain amino acid transport system ATP-binding protein
MGGSRELAAKEPQGRGMSALLETRGVGKAYGPFRALTNVSLSIAAGERLSIVGPNGAGKTTLVNLLTGLLVPSEGEVYFKNENIRGRGPVVLAERGLARAFQLVHIFPRLTVAETIAAAVVTRQKKRWRFFSDLAADRDVAERVAEVARIFGLGPRLDTVSQLLSQGEKKLLDVASAFALDPEVILLDEPTSGISTAEKHGIMKTLLAAAERAGVKALILVEHDMDLVAAYSTRIVAIAEGKVLADLPPKPFFENPAVIEIVVGKRRKA